MYYGGFFQARPKFSQIQPSPAKSGQRQSKEKAWISLDSLVRIEPFQGVALTPQAKNSFPAPYLAVGVRARAPSSGDGARYHDFRVSERKFANDG
jgi:hypothetical protein